HHFLHYLFGFGHQNERPEDDYTDIPALSTREYDEYADINIKIQNGEYHINDYDKIIKNNPNLSQQAKDAAQNYKILTQYVQSIMQTHNSNAESKLSKADLLQLWDKIMFLNYTIPEQQRQQQREQLVTKLNDACKQEHEGEIAIDCSEYQVTRWHYNSNKKITLSLKEYFTNQLTLIIFNNALYKELYYPSYTCNQQLQLVDLYNLLENFQFNYVYNNQMSDELKQQVKAIYTQVLREVLALNPYYNVGSKVNLNSVFSGASFCKEHSRYERYCYTEEYTSYLSMKDGCAQVHSGVMVKDELFGDDVHVGMLECDNKASMSRSV
ncbi:MAG: hypothetical protein AAF153_01025, partial [Pseudomonadota bacterium]